MPQWRNTPQLSLPLRASEVIFDNEVVLRTVKLQIHEKATLTSFGHKAHTSLRVYEQLHFCVSKNFTKQKNTDGRQLQYEVSSIGTRLLKLNPAVPPELPKIIDLSKLHKMQFALVTGANPVDCY